MLNNKYYKVNVAPGNEFPYLKMNKNSRNDLENGYKVGVDSPLKFTNGWRKENKDEGVIERVGEVLFFGSKIIISERIRDNIIELAGGVGINAKFYPAIYINDNDEWCENYWYVDVLSSIDCWDKDRSKFREIEDAGEFYYDVKEFILSEKELDLEADAGKMIFRLSGNVKPPLVINGALFNIFNVDGTELKELSM